MPVDVPIAAYPSNSRKAMPKISTSAELGCDDPFAAGINISPLTIEAHRREAFMEFTRFVVLGFVDDIALLVDHSQAP